MSLPELHYADIEIGYHFPAIVHEVTQEVIDKAALAHLDFNPVHTNIEWNQRAQVFGTEKTVGHGMLTMSMMASMIDRHWRHAGASIIRMQSKLVKPVEVGRVIRCEGYVKELHPRAANQSYVLVAVTAIDNEGSPVGVGDYAVRVPD